LKYTANKGVQPVRSADLAVRYRGDESIPLKCSWLWNRARQRTRPVIILMEP